MNMQSRTQRIVKHGLMAATAALLLNAGLVFADTVHVTLNGDQETPPVTTSASGTGTIKINDDKSVTGSIKTTGIAGMAAHIHAGAPGQAGPPVIMLKKSGDDEWMVPEGAKLTDAQYAQFKAGDLYVNVHSAAHKGGEIRGQLKP